MIIVLSVLLRITTSDLPLWYLKTFYWLLHCLSFCDLRLLIYPFGIIKLCYWSLHCLSFDLRLLNYPFGIIKLYYWSLHCLSFDLRLLNYPFGIFNLFIWSLYCLTFFELRSMVSLSFSCPVIFKLSSESDKCQVLVNITWYLLHEFESRSGEVCSIQHYVIKFVSDLRQFGGFVLVLRISPPINLTVTM